MRRSASIVAGAVLCSWAVVSSPAALAQPSAGRRQPAPPATIPVEMVEDRVVRVDGSLREWSQGSLNTVSTEQGSFAFGFRASAEGLLLAATVVDQRVVRRRRLAQPQDMLELQFSVPPEHQASSSDQDSESFASPASPSAATGSAATGSSATGSSATGSSATGSSATGSEVSWKQFSVQLYPGVSGRPALAQVIRSGSSSRQLGASPTATAVRVIEGPRSSRLAPAPDQPGFELEAAIPFSLFGAPGRWISAHVRVRLVDVDSETRPRPRVVRLPSANAPSGVPLRPLAGLGDVLHRFVDERALQSVTPSLERWVNVAGDEALEWVQLRGNVLMVLGPAYRRGRGMSVRELPAWSQQLTARFTDHDGDGREELAFFSLAASDDGSDPDALPEHLIDFGTESIEERRIGPATPVRSPRATASAPPTRPRFALPAGSERGRLRVLANVAEGPREELLMVMDRRLIVTGPGFRGGSRWFYFDLPVERSEDIQRLVAVDLTGDGRKEIVLQTRERVVPIAETASESNEGDAAAEDRPAEEGAPAVALPPIDRELITIYQFRPEAFRVLRTIEVAWHVGERRVEQAYRFVSAAGRGRLLVLGPLQNSEGRTWFWPRTPPGSSIDPLLPLPTGVTVTYRYNNSELTPERRPRLSRARGAVP